MPKINSQGYFDTYSGFMICQCCDKKFGVYTQNIFDMNILDACYACCIYFEDKELIKLHKIDYRIYKNYGVISEEDDTYILNKYMFS